MCVCVCVCVRGGGGGEVEPPFDSKFYFHDKCWIKSIKFVGITYLF